MTPSPPEALEKRIKRRVIGRPHDFFAATALGLEEICRAELAELGLNGRAEPGGVEFSGRLTDGWRANLHLRTAGRVLMRVHAFRASHFSELEGHIAAFAWELFLRPGTVGKVHVATHRCRLHHTEAVAERVREGIERRLAPFGSGAAPAGPPQQVFVRGARDRFTVSVDSSGENLYRRGLKTHPGKAPLRETLAAAALLQGGFTGAEPLLDPMCGTGTFALEAALIAKSIPPGWFREFAFQDWPSFRPRRWDYLRRKAAEGIRALSAPRIHASDIDPAVCSALEACLKTNGLSEAVAVACRDFFELDPRELSERPGKVVLNPPYGRRLGTAAQSRELHRAVLARLRERYRGWTFILVSPAGRVPPLEGLAARSLPFFHGGLRVNVLVGEVRAAGGAA